LLALGPQLDREIERHVRDRRGPVNGQVQLPKLRAGFRMADADSIIGQAGGSAGHVFDQRTLLLGESFSLAFRCCGRRSQLPRYPQFCLGMGIFRSIATNSASESAMACRSISPCYQSAGAATLHQQFQVAAHVLAGQQPGFQSRLWGVAICQAIHD